MIKIIRGTTPEITCKVPDIIDLSKVKEIWFTFEQLGKHLIDAVYSEGSIDISGQTLSVHLSQEDTLSFTATAPAECGVRILLNDGSAWSIAHPEKLIIWDITKDGVIE